MKELIRASVDDYIGTVYKTKKDLKKFLLGHPRKNLFCENMVKEIKSNQHKIHRGMIKGLVNDFTKAFCKHALEAKIVELTGKNTDTTLINKRLKDQRIEEEINEDLRIAKWANSPNRPKGWTPTK